MGKKESAGDGRGGAARLLLCTAGIYASYLTQGDLQEELSTRKYGVEKQRFAHIVFLNVAQAAVCLCWSAVWMLLRPPTRGSSSARHFWLPALSNTVGPALGVEALKNISYTAQVLAKSCKLIPVMVVGQLLHGKRYSLAEYTAAVLIAGGIVVFALAPNSSAVKAKLASPDAPIRGYLLVFINLGMDAYTNTTQDAITTRFRLTTPQQLMFYMNCWCTLYYTIYMFALPPNLLPAALSFLPAPGAGWEAVAFLRSYPEALRQVLLYCLCGAAGQMFIFMSISNFGSVVNITVTTTRKFFNVLLSVFHKGSALLPAQWAGVIMVFSGLGAQIQMKMSKHAAPASKAKKLK